MFRAALLRWFAAHRRPLPWRQDLDSYRIWISEIMLQQTRVGAVLEHVGGAGMPEQVRINPARNTGSLSGIVAGIRPVDTA